VNWTERDLDLFKSRRQRGTKPPPAKEFNLHALIGDVLARWCSKDWRYTHIASGEYRTKATAGRLHRMGVRPGWPDFIFLGPHRVCFLELKRPGGDLSDAQKDFAFFAMRNGSGYLLTDSFTDALNALRDWGIVPSTINLSGVT